MTAENWIDLNDIQAVAIAQSEGWEIECAAGEAYTYFTWNSDMWSAVRRYRGRPRQPKTTVELPVADVVQLQNAADGLWVHFRVGNGYAYSINLDTDRLGNRFANEYRQAVTGSVERPSQPKMREVKMLCYLAGVTLLWRTESYIAFDNWTRQPHLDMVAKVPE